MSGISGNLIYWFRDGTKSASGNQPLLTLKPELGQCIARARVFLRDNATGNVNNLFNGEPEARKARQHRRLISRVHAHNITSSLVTRIQNKLDVITIKTFLHLHRWCYMNFILGIMCSDF